MENKFTAAMMVFLLGTGLVSMLACLPPNNNPSSNRAEEQEHNQLILDSTSQYFNKQYRIYTLDSCEYIVVGYGNYQWGSHKGDCKNPIHKTQHGND